MFATLLATAMDARVAFKAHPAFVDVIKQLSSDEARILAHIGRRFSETYPIIEIYRTWPAVDGKGKSTQRSTRVFGPYSSVGFYAGCSHMKGMPTMISNLSRLGIIRVEFPHNIASHVLSDLLDDPIISGICKDIEVDVPEFRSSHQTGYFEITPFGEDFLDACVRHSISPER